MNISEQKQVRYAQGGFTLIELVIVLVILGVLAAVAVPQLGNLTSSADDTAMQAQASALNSANSMNVANCRLGNTAECEVIADCSGATALVSNFDTSKYTLATSGDDDNSFELTTNAGESSESTTTCYVTASSS